MSDLQKKLTERHAGRTLLVLDACRDTSGLTGMVPGPGTLIAFAAAAGQQISDDPLQPLDLFTKDLAAALVPYQNERDLFYRVQKAVQEDSSFKQLPYIAEALRDAPSAGPGVHPPAILVQVAPDYSEEARAAQISGQVVLKVVIDTRGIVISFRL
jgi:hypothetical protein